MAIYPRTFEQCLKYLELLKLPTEYESILGKIVHNENDGPRW